MTFGMKYFIGIETEEVSRLVGYSYILTLVVWTMVLSYYEQKLNKKLSQPMTIINVYDQFSVYVHYLCMIACFHLLSDNCQHQLQ